MAGFSPWRYADEVSHLVSGLPAVQSGNRMRGATFTDLSGEAEGPVPVVGMPSVQLVPLHPGISVQIRLNTQYMATLDSTGLEQIADTMLSQMKAMSQGPFTLAMLAKAGHPYGRMANRLGRPVPRRLGGKSIGNVKGVRGSVPTLSVVNKQTGLLADSWTKEIVRDSGGVTIYINNTAPEAEYVALGTRLMQAHGPFTSIPAMDRPMLLREWQSEVQRAFHIQQIENSLTTLGTYNAGIN